MAKDIAVETVKAQEYLAGINNAINRDTLIAEQKAKNIMDLAKQEKDLQDSINQLSETKSNAEAALISVQNMNSTKIARMNEEKLKLQAELDEIGKNISLEKENLVKIQEAGKMESKRIAIEIDKMVATQEKNRKFLQDEIDMIKDNSLCIKKENENLISENSKIISSIEDNKNILDAQKPLLGEILVNQNKLDNIKYDIQIQEENKKQLLAEISSINIDILAKKQEQEEVSKELEIQKTEKDQFIKDKLSLSAEKQALQQREERVKYAFEQAGIAF